MLKSRMKHLLVGSLLVFASAAAQSAELVTNGGFESGSTGWTVNASTVKFIPITDYNACCAPFRIYPYGAQAAFFGGGDTTGGSIVQDISTLAGSSYTFSFAYGAISEFRLQQMVASVFNGPGLSTIASFSLFAIGTQNLAAMMNTASVTFQAQSALTRISFLDTSSGTTSVDGVLDAVSFTGPAPVPEPSTYALMLAGLGIVAFAARRRRKSGQALGA